MSENNDKVNKSKTNSSSSTADKSVLKTFTENEKATLEAFQKAITSSSNSTAPAPAPAPAPTPASADVLPSTTAAKPSGFTSLLRRLATQPKKESPYPPAFLRPSSISFHNAWKKDTTVLPPLYSDYTESKFQWLLDKDKQEVIQKANGVFSFGLFRNYLDLDFKADLYREGISQYIELTKRKAFEDYIIVVYIDESVINTDFFSNPEYFNKLLLKSYIYDNFGSTYKFEETRKFIHDKALEATYMKTKQQLDNDYIARVNDLLSKITNKNSAEMDEEMKKLNIEFREIYFKIKHKHDAEQEEYRKKYFDDKINKLKPNVDKKIEELISKTKQLLDVLQSTPNCILCKYTIPTFLIPGTPFHYNYIGSMVRFQAIAEFPDKRVCVRDADTYFPNIWDKPIFRWAYLDEIEKNNNSNSEKRKKWKLEQRILITKEKERINLRTDIAEHYTDYLEGWEANLKEYHYQKGLPFLIAYDTNYYFTDKRTKNKDNNDIINSRFLAGIVDALPHEKSFFTQEDWEEGVRFIRDDGVIYNIRGSKNLLIKERKEFKEFKNSKGMTYYGCDEKVLRYIYFEKWKGKVTLFYFPYAYGNNLLLFSQKENEISFLNTLLKLLAEHSTEKEKQSSLYKFILNEAERMYTLQNRTEGGQTYFYKDYYFFAPSYPLIADQLAKISDNKVLENIKPFLQGGSKKTRKRNTKKSHKRRKSRKH